MFAFLRKLFGRKRRKSGGSDGLRGAEVGTTNPSVGASGDSGIGPDETANAQDHDIAIPWQSILAGLPKEFQSHIVKRPGGKAGLDLARATVLEQLARGAVTVRFGDIRKKAPADTFARTAVALDSKNVALPLKDILAQISPQQLPRRTNQRHVEVSEEIAAVFGPKGERIKPPDAGSIAAAKPEQPAEPAAPAPAPVAPSPTPAVSERAAAKEEPIVAGIDPDAPAERIKPQIPLPEPAALRDSTSTSAAPSGVTPPTPAVPADGIGQSQPLPASAQAADAGSGDVLVIPADRIKGVWPEAVRSVLPAASRLVLPLNELEPGLKEGKIEFAWKRLRAAVDPAVPADAAGAESETMLDLPLSVVAPLFVARRQRSGGARVKVDTTIPPLFLTGKVPPSDASVNRPAPLSDPDAAGQAAVPSTAPAPASGVEGLKAAIGEMLGAPDRTTWSPGNLVEAVVERFGAVTGALITMQDGLMVAGRLPAEMNSDNIAAFLPQAYHRIEELFSEMNAPAPGAITLDNGIYSLRVFKTEKVFFAALGSSGQPMPEPQLQQIASYLATHP